MEKKSALSPLWIISLFVTFTETVLGYALTRTVGGIQVALTVFVIVFALLVVVAFFLILWHRPYHFYAPSDFGGVDPAAFIGALRGTPKEAIRQAKVAAGRPKEDEALFPFLDTILEDHVKQQIVLMHEKHIDLPASMDTNRRYSYGKRGRFWGAGIFVPESFRRRLDGTEFLTIAPGSGGGLRLTDRGRRYADWLTKTGERADFFASDLGGWGEPFSRDEIA